MNTEINQLYQLVDAQKIELERRKQSSEWADQTRLALAKELGVVATASQVVAEVQKLKAECAKLRAAIHEHRSQRADDRCWMDDDKLYEALGDGIKADRRVGDKDAMLANCKRYIERRCEGGHWPSYAELEASLAQYRTYHINETCKLTKEILDLRTTLAAYQK